jgi:hypothetical protein
MLTDLQVYDRYALPIGAAVGLLLASSPPAAPVPARPRRAGRAAVAVLGAVTLLGLAFTADSASFDGARWRVASAAVRAGWPARTVNGGFEWRNFHRGD